MAGETSTMFRSDHPDDLRTTYLNALLQKPEISGIPFADQQERIPFADLYVDRTVVEERREKQAVPGAEVGDAHTQHAAMMQEVVKLVEVDLWQALQDHRRVVVEAPAWTGKSTLCQWVVQHCLEKTTTLPIFIHFRDYAQSGKAIQSYLDKDYTTWLGLQQLRIVAELPDRSEQVVSVGRWLDTEWQAGRALLILDRADEEFVVERRRQALDSLRLSRDRTTIPRVLLTSRPGGLSGVSGFEKIELRELEPRQMDQLMRQCGVILGAPQQAEQFIQDIHRTEHQSAWQLAKWPGHLVQMVVTYVHDVQWSGCASCFTC